MDAVRKTGATLGQVPSNVWSGIRQAGESVGSLMAGVEVEGARMIERGVEALPEVLQGAEVQYLGEQAGERADKLERMRARVGPWQEAETERQKKKAEAAGASPFVAEAVTGGTRSLGESLSFAPYALGGPLSVPAAMIGGTGLMSIDRTIQEAEREGLSEAEKWNRVASASVSDVAIPSLFQSVGLGGFEDIFSPAKRAAAKSGILAGTKRVLGRFTAEQAEETASFVNDMVTEYRWNPDELGPDEVFDAYKKMAAMVTVAQLGGEATNLPGIGLNKAGEMVHRRQLRQMARADEGRAQREALVAKGKRFESARDLLRRPIETLTPAEVRELEDVIAIGREDARAQGRDDLVAWWDSLSHETPNRVPGLAPPVDPTLPTEEAPDLRSFAQKPDATPAAEKAAKAKGIRLSDITETGRGGRIIKRDVDNADAPAQGELVAEHAPQTEAPTEKDREQFMRENQEVIEDENEALAEFRQRLRKAGIRPVKDSGLTYEDFGGRFPPGVIKKAGSLTWDQALEEAKQAGLVGPEAGPEDLRNLFTGPARQWEVRETTPEEALFQLKQMPVEEVNEAEIQPGALVFMNGEWHQAKSAQDGGKVLEDGERIKVDDFDSTEAQAVVQPDESLHAFAQQEYAEQERLRQLSPDTREALSVYGPRTLEVLQEQRAVLKQSGQDTSEVDRMIGELSGTATSMQSELFAAEPQSEPETPADEMLPGMRTPPESAQLGGAFFSQPNAPYTPALLSEPEAACEECDSVARDFESFAEERGVNVEPVTVKGRKAPVGEDAADVIQEQSPEELVHTVIRMPDGTYLDLASAQFGSEYSGIRVLTEEGLRREWAQVGAELPPRPTAADTIRQAAQRRETEATGREGLLESIDQSMQALEEQEGRQDPVDVTLENIRAENEQERSQRTQRGAVYVGQPGRRRRGFRAQDPETQRVHNETSVPPRPEGVVRKAWNAFKSAGLFMVREQRHIPQFSTVYAPAKEMLNQFVKGVPSWVQRKTQSVLEEVTAPINAIEDHIERQRAHDTFNWGVKLRWANEALLRSRQESEQKGELPTYEDVADLLETTFELTPEQVLVELERFERQLAEWPEVRKALENRRRMLRSVTQEAKALGMIDSGATGDWYFHFAIQRYLYPDKFGKIGSMVPVRARKRGHQKARKERTKEWGDKYRPSSNFFVYEQQYYLQHYMEAAHRSLLIRLHTLYNTADEDGVVRIAGEPVTDEYVDYYASTDSMFRDALDISRMPEHLVNHLSSMFNLSEAETNALKSAIHNQHVRLPEPLKRQLESMRPQAEGVSQAWTRAMRFIAKGTRQTLLYMPWRISQFALRNLTGDLPILVATNPAAVKSVWTAFKQASNFHLRGQSSTLLDSAMQHSVIHGGLYGAMELGETRWQELGRDLENMSKAAHQKEGWKAALRKTGAIVSYSAGLPTRAIGILEDTPRLASYKAYLDKMKQGKPIRNYGASRKKTVDALRRHLGDEWAAAHMARRLSGDYAYTTQFGSLMRQYLMPFWGFTETVIRRLGVYGSNIVADTSGATRTNRNLNRALTALSLALPHLLLQAWNNMVMGDVEDELNTWQRIQPHLNLRYSKNGNHIVFNGVGLLADIQDWLGLDRLRQLMPYIKEDQMGLGTAAQEMGQAMASRAFNSLQPLATGAGSALTGINTYPDVTQPRRQPVGEAVMGGLGLGREFRALAQGDIPGGGTEFSRLERYALDLVADWANARETILYRPYDHIEAFKTATNAEDKEIRPPSQYSDMKRAVLRDDTEYFKRAKQRYLKAGGTEEKFMRYLGKGTTRRRTKRQRDAEGVSAEGAFDPLKAFGSNAEREQFKAWCTDEQWRDLQRAQEVANDIRGTLVEWWDADRRGQL
jgi:pyruvate/2-oxoglutarate dehydrogenase complex dihydrolipoamide acyltransferase (E2) component